MSQKNVVIGTAIVRDVAATFDSAIRPPDSDGAIDIDLARKQHIAYAQAIAGAGVSVERLPGDDRYPDCCFVEDPVFVVGETAFVCNMVPESRRGESVAVGQAISRFRELKTMDAPATMDGGDIITTGAAVYVGLSERTNIAAVKVLRAALAPVGIDVVAVEIRGVLHLKSACTYLGDDVLLAATENVDLAAFHDLRVIDVPAGEEYAANCLSVNGRVLSAQGYPQTHERLRAEGYDVVILDMSEFRKAGGSLTCLSILL